MRRFALALALPLALVVAGCAPTKAELAHYAAIDAAHEKENERVGAAFVRRWQERNRPEIESGTPPPAESPHFVTPAEAAAEVFVSLGFVALRAFATTPSAPR